MGCICGCHEKLDALGINGCCFVCEKDHDPLRNALAAANALLAKLGTDAHPVEKAWEPEFLALELLVAKYAEQPDCGAIHKGAYGANVPACQLEQGHSSPHKSGSMEWSDGAV